ncbi:ORF6C domain-containing protein [Clostridium thermobutyricum]|uniref:ORF6C domain-containing protein n=1 Tax=Clostridium thermobutyricum TaxID=29372 RepID=UPI0018AA4C15|nr:ORF6C domain-containing protein [Clostridium thermobutyricum]
MNNLVLKEKQEFMGVRIPVIEGGFGEGQKVILAKTIAEIHSVSTPDINKLINRNIERFTINDLLDIKTQSSRDHVLTLGFTQAEYGNSKNIFILSQRGYTKLVAMMDNSNDKKWDVMNNLIDEYFILRAKDKSGQVEFETKEDMFIYQLQELKKTKQQLNEVNHRALVTEENVESLKKDFINYKENECLSGVERDEITSLVKAIGVKAMGGKETKSYKNKSLRSRVYANIHKELRNQFDVPGYKYIKRKYFSKAKEVIYNYRLTIALREEIDLANSQVEFESLD